MLRNLVGMLGSPVEPYGRSQKSFNEPHGVPEDFGALAFQGRTLWDILHIPKRRLRVSRIIVTNCMRIFESLMAPAGYTRDTYDIWWESLWMLEKLPGIVENLRAYSGSLKRNLRKLMGSDSMAYNIEGILKNPERWWESWTARRHLIRSLRNRGNI